MEVCEAVPTLNIIDAKTNLLVTLILIIVQVSKVHLKDSALQAFRSNLGTLRLADQGFAAATDTEHAWCLDIIPFLSQEGIALLLLATLLTTLGEALVFANSHIWNTR